MVDRQRKRARSTPRYTSSVPTTSLRLSFTSALAPWSSRSRSRQRCPFRPCRRPSRSRAWSRRRHCRRARATWRSTSRSRWSRPARPCRSEERWDRSEAIRRQSSGTRWMQRDRSEEVALRGSFREEPGRLQRVCLRPDRDKHGISTRAPGERRPRRGESDVVKAKGAPPREDAPSRSLA